MLTPLFTVPLLFAGAVALLHGLGGPGAVVQFWLFGLYVSLLLLGTDLFVGGFDGSV